MVDVKEYPDLKYAIFKTDKREGEYTLYKDNSGYAHFVFRVNVGSLPKELQGKYTSLRAGREAFEAFDRQTKQSISSRQKELQEFREKRRGKSSTESQ